MPDVRMPDGRIIKNVPEGTTKAQIMAKLGGQQQPPKSNQSLGSGIIDAFTKGVAFGFGDELTAGESALLGRTPDGGWFDYSKPMSQRYNEALAAERGQNKAFAEENPGTALASEVAGGITTGLLTGGATTGLRGAANAAGQGALYGFGSGEGGLEERAKSAALGTAGGLTGHGIGRGVSRVLAAKTAPAAQALINEGVPLTPGQISGGFLKSIEDKATSIPILGGAIETARNRGVLAFNKAAVNRALKPLGKKLPDGVKAGHEAVEYAQNALSEAYEELLPSLKVKLDQTFVKEFGNLQNLAREMPAEKVTQFNKVMQREIFKRFSEGGVMSGRAMKEAESELGRLVRNYAGSPVGDERLLGNALREAQSQLRDLVARSNPDKAIKLKSINKGFATLMRPERAASMAKDGVFTPGQLQTATRVLDKTGRKKASAGGNALMQDLAVNAREVLPSGVADSGTAGRMLPWLIAGGGAYGAQSDDPLLQGLGVAGVLGAGAYTPAGQAALSKIMASRPDLLRNMGGLLGNVPFAAPGAALVTAP